MKAKRPAIAAPGHAEAVVIGGSLGALQALQSLLPLLPVNYALPIIVVLHQHRHASELLGKLLAAHCALPVSAIEDKAPILPGQVYLCPANYHVLIEEARTFALSVEPLVNFSRPSIDVLFESAAVAYGAGLVGVLLSGASSDGAAGLGAIKARGGTVFCQAPESAIEPIMPRAGCAATRVDRVASPTSLGRELSELSP
jgi:two-component system, chemotaxis family, protein-glutamate methylesterase/glutaminase